MVFTVTIQQIEDFQTICVNYVTHFLGPDLQLFEVQIKAKRRASKTLFLWTWCRTIFQSVAPQCSVQCCSAWVGGAVLPSQLQLEQQRRVEYGWVAPSPSPYTSSHARSFNVKLSSSVHREALRQQYYSNFLLLSSQRGSSQFTAAVLLSSSVKNM